MRTHADRLRFAEPVLVIAPVALAVTAPTVADATETGPDNGPPVLTYREADDPVEQVLAAARRLLETEQGSDGEAAVRSLRALDRTIPTRLGDPRLHWSRGLILSHLNRNAEARAAREKAIELARLWPGGDDLLPDYYASHASYCAEEGDPAAAVSFLTHLDLTPVRPNQYKIVAGALRKPSKRTSLRRIGEMIELRKLSLAMRLSPVPLTAHRELPDTISFQKVFSIGKRAHACRIGQWRTYPCEWTHRGLYPRSTVRT
jgi:hypothetical protein